MTRATFAFAALSLYSSNAGPDAIVNGGPDPYPTLVDGARAVAVVFAAEEAAKSEDNIAVLDLRKEAADKVAETINKNGGKKSTYG